VKGDDTYEQRRAIMRRYGRFQRGKLSFCGLSNLEKEGRAPFHPQPNGKVIYNSRELADAAARELLALTGIAFRPYECPRSRHGHHHLTVDRSPAVLARQRAERSARRAAGGR